MNVYDFFIQCEKHMPEKRTPLRRTSFSLRRAGVKTMEKLCDMRTRTPQELVQLRDIGPKSLAIIDEVIGLLRERKQGDKK